MKFPFLQDELREFCPVGRSWQVFRSGTHEGRGLHDMLSPSESPNIHAPRVGESS